MLPYLPMPRWMVTVSPARVDYEYGWIHGRGGETLLVHGRIREAQETPEFLHYMHNNLTRIFFLHWRHMAVPACSIVLYSKLYLL